MSSLPLGYGYHGDFMMGWDESFLQDAVNTCTNPSGLISDCPLFTLQTSAAYSNCNITVPSALESENVVGGMATLPGNPAIVSGPGYASGAEAGGNSVGATATTIGSAVVPTLSYSAGSSIASSDTYVPGAIFAAKATASPASHVQEAVVTPAPVASPSNTQSFFSTEYSTSGQQVMEVLWVEEVVTITASSTSTVVVPGRKRHLHKHRGVGGGGDY